MKKILYIFLGSILLFFVSCDDFDVRTTDRLTEEEVWKDEKLIVAALANLYDGLQVEHNGSYFEGWDVWNINLTSTSDEGTGAYQAGDFGVGDVARANFNNEWFGWWKDGYAQIRANNVFLKKLHASPVEANVKEVYDAEVRFLRAFNYFSLVKRYGGVPIILEVQEYNGIDDLAKLQVPRDKEEAVWDFIINELEEIAPKMTKVQNNDYRTRATMYSAYALQSRAALYAASVAKYGKVQLNGIVGVDKNKADVYWQKAADAADMVLTSGEYSLYKKHADKVENYRNLFLEKRGNSEFIFWKEFSAPMKAHSFDLLNVPFSFVQNGYGNGINATLDLVESYEYKDGTDGKLKLKSSNGDYIKYDSPLELFKDKDPRLRATFYLPFDECRGGTLEIRRGIFDNASAGASKFITSGNPAATYGSGADKMTILGKDGVWDTGDVGKTGFYTKKFADESLTDIRGERSDTPWPVFRLAEMYLNKAEALVELGNASEAMGAVNEVRDRAGIAKLGVADVTIDRVRNERKVEFAYENHRHWDLKRWRIAHEVLRDFETKALYPWYVWGENKYIFTTGKAPKPNKVFQDKNYYIKIKDEDMSSNPKLGPNNPGF